MSRTPRDLARAVTRRLYEAAHGAPPSRYMRAVYRRAREVVLLTARHEGRDNVWPVDWHMPQSFTPELYALSLDPGSYGARQIVASGVFVVNFVPGAWEDAILACGRASGGDVDKFALTGLVKEEARAVPAPRLADALGWLECRVRSADAHGDHLLVIGEVAHAEAPPEVARLWHRIDGGP